MNLLYQLPCPVIFAHRGASAFAPENTITSFKLAEEIGAAAVELDVKLSLDGQVIVIHDPNTKRTTGIDRWVNQENYVDLRKLNAGSYFSQNQRIEKIPLLEEVFDCLGQRLLINIELTNYNSPRDSLVEKTTAISVRCGMQDNILFSSFSPINLIKAHKIMADVPVALLAQEGSLGWWTRSLMARWFFPAILHPNYKDVNQRYIQREHRRNRRIHVWTVNSELEISRMVEIKVDGLFTDNPVLAKKILEDG